MKIVFVTLHLGYGGIEKAVCDQANILSKKYDVEIICVYKMFDNPIFEINEKVKIKYLINDKQNKDQFMKAVKSFQVLKILKEGIKSVELLVKKQILLKKEMKKNQDSTIIATNIYISKLLAKYGGKSCIKIMQEHNHHKNNKKHIDTIVTLAKKCDYLMPVSKELTTFYSNYIGKAKCIYIPHFIEYMPKKLSNLKSNNIVSIGRLSKEKGYADLIKVFECLSKENDHVTLNIIGDGNQKENLKRIIKDFKLEKKVILHGAQKREFINKMLLNSSIYTMCSFEESFGIVLLEAASFGLPLIAFDSAQGAHEIINDNQNGYLIKNRNLEEYAKHLNNLLLNYDLRKSLGEKARLTANSFSKEKIEKEWFEFIDSIKTDGRKYE
ncbi:MAG: glycosyltransferase [Bacilli bacterium]